MVTASVNPQYLFLQTSARARLTLCLGLTRLPPPLYGRAQRAELVPSHLCTCVCVLGIQRPISGKRTNDTEVGGGGDFYPAYIL